MSGNRAVSCQEERNYEIKMGEQELGRRGGSRSKADFFSVQKDFILHLVSD